MGLLLEEGSSVPWKSIKLFFISRPFRPTLVLFSNYSSSVPDQQQERNEPLILFHHLHRVISIRHANLNYYLSTCLGSIVRCPSSNPFNKLIAQLCCVFPKGRDGAASSPERTPHAAVPATSRHGDGSLQQATVNGGLWWTSCAFEEWWHYWKEFCRVMLPIGQGMKRCVIMGVDDENEPGRSIEMNARRAISR